MAEQRTMFHSQEVVSYSHVGAKDVIKSFIWHDLRKDIEDMLTKSRVDTLERDYNLIDCHCNAKMEAQLTDGDPSAAATTLLKYFERNHSGNDLLQFCKFLRDEVNEVKRSAKLNNLADRIERAVKDLDAPQVTEPIPPPNPPPVESTGTSSTGLRGPAPSNPPPGGPINTNPTSSTGVNKGRKCPPQHGSSKSKIPSSDSEESEKQQLQVYEDLVDQDYDPFHETCGKEVFFSNKRIIATRRSKQFANGMAFSAKPIPLGGMFQVKLLQIHREWPSEILAIGFTSQDPDTMDPDVITNTDLRKSKYYWLFWGSIVCHDGEKNKLSPGSLPSSFVEGDSIGCCITRGGDLEIYINGQKKATGWRNVPVDMPLWGAVEIYWKARTVQSEFYCDEPPLPPLVEHLLDEALLNKLYPLRECEDSTPEDPEVEDSGPDGAYRMSTYPRGPAIIINNKIFQPGSSLDDRPGTEKDSKALQHLFTSSGFVTSTFNDLTAGCMQQVLQSYAKRNHTKAQCLIVAILTHGGEGGSLYGVDGRLVKVETLTEFFTGGNCPSLVGKPKLFFIQACRGKKRDSAVKGSEETDSLQQTNEIADGLKEVILPSQSDFLLSFSTVEGYVSWRHAVYGSWYVRDLVEVFTKNAAKEHLLDMLTMVNNKVSKRSASKDGSKQTSSVKTELRKNLFFKPGEYDLNHLDREPNWCCIS